MRVDFGEPLHSLVVCAELHPLEEELLKLFWVKPEELVLEEVVEEEEDGDLVVPSAADMERKFTQIDSELARAAEGLLGLKLKKDEV